MLNESTGETFCLGLGIRMARSAEGFRTAQQGPGSSGYQTLKGTPPCAASPGTDTPLGTIDGITVTVNCKTIAVDESGTTALYEITAFACSETTCPNSTSPGPYYVERKVTALTGL